MIEHAYARPQLLPSASWSKLFNYALPRIVPHAVPEFSQRIARLHYKADAPPDFYALQQDVWQQTGWQLQPAAGEVPMSEFLAMLAQKNFPVVLGMRPESQIFAASVPDLWHEVIGHVPMLLDIEMRAFLHDCGQLGAEVCGETSELLNKLYWFVAEYGLVRSASGPKVVGAALLSSPLAGVRLSAGVHKIRAFSMRRLRNTPMQYADLQREVFCFASLADARKWTEAIAAG